MKNSKRFEARFETWYINDDKTGDEIPRKMWGVYDNFEDDWAVLPEHIDGSYNRARTGAKELNNRGGQ